MPRYKKRAATVERRENTRKKYNVSNYKGFVDPYPEVHGTLPEKMVYAALTQAGVTFYFLNDIDFSDPAIDFFKSYQADFIIPSTKTIIEVQGTRWHSTPDAIISDSYKLAVYEAFGYTALAWWDIDIQSNLVGLITSAPTVMAAMGARPNPNVSGEIAPIKRTKVDTSKGIRTMNAKKRKPYRILVGTSRRKIRKATSSYGTR